MSDAATSTAAPQSTPATQQGGEQSATSTGAPAAGQQSATEEFEELEVNGAKRRVPKPQLKTWAQRGFAAEEKFREAARLRQEQEAEWEGAKKDPRLLRDLLKKRGFEPKDVLPRLVLDDAEEASLTPAEREARELKQKLAAIEAEKAKAEEEKKQQHLAAKREEATKSYVAKWTEALGKVGIPAGSPTMGWAMQRMAQLERANLESPEPLSADELATVLRDDLEAEHSALFGSMPADALLQRLGGVESPVVAGLVKAFVAARQQATAPKTQQPAAPLVAKTAAEKARDEKGRFTPEEFDRDAYRFKRL